MDKYPAVDAIGLPRRQRGNASPLWWGAAGAVVMVSMWYGGLIVSYFYLRMGQPSWPPPNLGVPGLVLPTIGSAILWGSALALWASSRSLRAGVRRSAALFLLLGVLLAATFEGLKVVEVFGVPFGWDSSPYASIWWVMNGVHFLNVAALIFWAIPVLAGVWGEYIHGERRAGFEALRFYWHFVLAAWIAFYFILYYGERIWYGGGGLI